MSSVLVGRDVVKRVEAGAHTSPLVVGCRIPHSYFVTQGRGESDITIHAGSYHLALRSAGIEMCNIITYSSILPGIAQETERPTDGTLVHGSVMETIMADATATRGERATAGLVTGWLYDRETGGRYGGFVCEYHGDKSAGEVALELGESIHELYENGYSERYLLRDISTRVESFVPVKQYGTAIVAICFTDYVVPVLSQETF